MGTGVFNFIFLYPLLRGRWEFRISVDAVFLADTIPSSSPDPSAGFSCLFEIEKRMMSEMGDWPY
jgi:hypothetical protein